MKTIIDTFQFERTLKRMAHEIIENNDDLNHLIVVGIEKKGTPFAKQLVEYIEHFENVKIPLEVIDIRAHRDDDKKTDPIEISFQEEITNKTIILVDDVLYTGRSVRAAMDAIMDIGRPAKIKLAVFVDRGHRELPIRADIVGKNIPTSRNERIVCDFENRCVKIELD